MTTLNAADNWYCARCASRNPRGTACGGCGREPHLLRMETSKLDPKWLETLRTPVVRAPSIAQLRHEQQRIVNDIFDETRRKLQTGDLPELP